MRALVCFALVVISLGAPLAAQNPTTPGRLCLRARPTPHCDAFVLTNVGGYVVLTRNTGAKRSLRAVLDYGYMANINARDAFGGSVFASLDDEGFALGPAVRYRRWLTAAASVEVAVGTPLVAGDGMKTGAVFGLVKWSPNHWFSLAARPELVRSRVRVSVGTEVGAVPGLVITGAAGVAFVAFLAILLAGGYSGD